MFAAKWNLCYFGGNIILQNSQEEVECECFNIKFHITIWLLLQTLDIIA